MLLLTLFADGSDRSKVVFYHPTGGRMELKLLDVVKHGWAVYDLSYDAGYSRDAARECEWRRVFDDVTISFDVFRVGECRIVIDAPRGVEVWRKKLDRQRAESADAQEGVRRGSPAVPGPSPDAAVQAVRQGGAALPPAAVPGVREET